MADDTSASCLRVLYISHGAGPVPLLDGEGHAEMIDCLKTVAATIARPSAIMVISAHWEEDIPTITFGQNPPLEYDYYGFPEQAYEIEYPASGNPGLAETVHALLGDNGIPSKLDPDRGFDHGVFVPLKIMYPEADIPCIQLSLKKGLDPGEHIRIGKALSGLEEEGLLVVGSGFSFHNMRAFFAPPTAETVAMNEAFEQWLVETCSSTALDEKARELRLKEWERAPSARYCHPREEHLLPLHVCYGIVKRACTRCFRLNIIEKKASFYYW